MNKKPISKSGFHKPISIIICAKNEADNLKKFLPKVLEQDYPEFEVVVVNDQSKDGTAAILKNFEKSYPKLVIVTIDEHIKHWPGKKFALTLGIKTARHEHLLLTDADCLPNSSNWSKQMSSNFNNSEIVLGFGGYQKRKGLLNKIIRFDTFNVAKQYLSYSLAGFTYMGVGRNMAYKKSLFFENKGFANHLHITSGDDDLFIQEIANKNNVSIEITEQAHTTSTVIEKWREWAYQKRRHITTASLYKTKFKILLTLYPYAQTLFWAALFLLFLIKAPLQFCIILLGVKIFLSYLVNYKAMKILKVMDLYWMHPVYEIMYLCIQGIFVLLNIVSKPKKWSR
ncbi:MAG: glycosyltransferase [Flavobacteriales bacterium]|nr:glycosyltransferase [Flavobacteriales bacterium]